MHYLMHVCARMCLRACVRARVNACASSHTFLDMRKRGRTFCEDLCETWACAQNMCSQSKSSHEAYSKQGIQRACPGTTCRAAQVRRGSACSAWARALRALLAVRLIKNLLSKHEARRSPACRASFAGSLPFPLLFSAFASLELRGHSLLPSPRSSPKASLHNALGANTHAANTAALHDRACFALHDRACFALHDSSP